MCQQLKQQVNKNKPLHVLPDDEKLSGCILSIVLGALTTQLRNTCTNCSNCAPSRPPARPSLLIQKWDFALQPDFYPQGFQLSQTKTGKGCAWLRPGSRRQGDTSSCTRRFLNPSGDTRPQGCFQQGLYDQVQTLTLLPRGSRNEHHVVPGREHRPRP